MSGNQEYGGGHRSGYLGAFRGVLAHVGSYNVDPMHPERRAKSFVVEKGKICLVSCRKSEIIPFSVGVEKAECAHAIWAFDINVAVRDFQRFLLESRDRVRRMSGSEIALFGSTTLDESMTDALVEFGKGGSTTTKVGPATEILNALIEKNRDLANDIVDCMKACMKGDSESMKSALEILNGRFPQIEFPEHVSDFRLRELVSEGMALFGLGDIVGDISFYDRSLDRELSDLLLLRGMKT